MDVIRTTGSAERQRQLDEIKAAAEDDLSEWLKEYDHTLNQLDEAQDRICDLEAENENLRANQQIHISDPISVEPIGVAKDDEVQVSSVHEAVSQAAKYTRNSEFLPTAYSSAKRSPFQRPYDIYKALKDLDEFVDDGREQHSSGDILQHLRDRGWGKRSSMHISKTTRGKFREDYEFKYDDTKKLFEPHITIGSGDHNSCASIHFIFDRKKEKMIIAHVGKHLRNTKT